MMMRPAKGQMMPNLCCLWTELPENKLRSSSELCDPYPGLCSSFFQCPSHLEDWCKLDI